MGTIIKKNIISGSVGKLVFRNLDGKQIVQSHPEDIKQTKATKASGSEFRQCSTWAKQLRIGLSPFLIDKTDSYMYRRLTGQLYTALLSNTHLPKGGRTPLNANMQDLEGFDFNSHSPFTDYFIPRITTVVGADRQLQLTVPELDPKNQVLFPSGVHHAELVVVVYATSFDYSTTTVEASFVLPFERNAVLPNETIWTSPPIPENYFMLVAAKLLFYKPDKFMGKNYLNSKTLNPAGVVFCEGGGN